MVQTDVTPLLDVGVSSSGVGRFSLSTQTPSLAVDRGTQACPSDLHDPPYFLTKFYSRSLGYSCERCKKVFYTQDILDRHWQNEHVMSRRTVHTCAYCPYSNVDKARIVKHERTHTGEKPFRCEYCQKGFAARGNLVKHYQVHTGEKKHECSHCGKAFAWKRNLKLHLLSHTGGRRYSCRQCGKKFCDSTHLRTHERLVHLRLYMLYCPHCCKGARTAGQLRAHIRKEHDSVGEGDPQKDSEVCFLHVKSVPMEERTAPEEVVQGPGVTHIDVPVVAERHVLLH